MCFSNLQQLRLDGEEVVGCILPHRCLPSLAQLHQLTSLTLTGSWTGVQRQLQQLLVQPLPLRRLKMTVTDDYFKPPAAGPALRSLAHLAHLTELSIGMFGCATLPTHLQALDYGYCTNIAPLLALEQLQRLSLRPSFEQQSQLLELASLPALKELHLHYYSDKYAAAAAPTWALLPLRRLSVEAVTDSITWQRSMAVIAGAAAASQLTSLRMYSGGYWSPSLHKHARPVCGKLAALGSLRNVRLSSVCLFPSDAQALTALTALTRLELNDSQVALVWQQRLHLHAA